jgi:hypothetical protein
MGKKKDMNKLILKSLSLALVGIVYSNISYAALNVNVDIQTAILVKSLGYNKNLSNSVNIAVLFNSSSTKSQSIKNDFISNINVLKKSSDKQINISSVNSVSDLKNQNIDIVYISDDFIQISDVKKIAQNKKFLTWSSNPDHVKDGITSISVMNKNNRPKIIVNLETLKSEGQSLSSNLLKICETI